MAIPATLPQKKAARYGCLKETKVFCMLLTEGGIIYTHNNRLVSFSGFLVPDYLND